MALHLSNASAKARITFAAQVGQFPAFSSAAQFRGKGALRQSLSSQGSNSRPYKRNTAGFHCPECFALPLASPNAAAGFLRISSIRGERGKGINPMVNPRITSSTAAAP